MDTFHAVRLSKDIMHGLSDIFDLDLAKSQNIFGTLSLLKSLVTITL